MGLLKGAVPISSLKRGRGQNPQGTQALIFSLGFLLKVKHLSSLSFSFLVRIVGIPTTSLTALL